VEFHLSRWLHPMAVTARHLARQQIHDIAATNFDARSRRLSVGLTACFAELFFLEPAHFRVAKTATSSTTAFVRILPSHPRGALHLDFPAFPALATALSRFLAIGFELIHQTLCGRARGSGHDEARHPIGSGDRRRHREQMVIDEASFKNPRHIKSPRSHK
jgi:hypothetical protein